MAEYSEAPAAAAALQHREEQQKQQQQQQHEQQQQQHHHHHHHHGKGENHHHNQQQQQHEGGGQEKENEKVLDGGGGGGREEKEGRKKQQQQATAGDGGSHEPVVMVINNAHAVAGEGEDEEIEEEHRKKKKQGEEGKEEKENQAEINEKKAEKGEHKTEKEEKEEKKEEKEEKEKEKDGGGKEEELHNHQQTHMQNELFRCHPQQISWGPATCDSGTRSECLSALAHLPFEPSVRPSLFSHQPFRTCDFTFLFTQRQRDARDVRGLPLAFLDEEQQFQTVDSRPLLKRAGGGWLHRRRAPVKQTTAAFNEKNKEEEELRLGKKGKSEQKKQQQQQQARFARIHARHRAFSEWSIQPTNEWTVEAELPLSQLHKHAIESSRVKVKDLEWRGELRTYYKQADRISTKLPATLQNLSSNFDYYWVSTQDDDLIREHMLNSEEPIDVGATDQVLACLMAAPQGKYSWHLHLSKIEGKLLIDKANGSIVDLLTVNETASEPPMQDAENRLNRPAALGYEAVKVNQNLRQQLLVKGEEPIKFPPAPFVEKGDNPASVAYRYRIFTIPPRTTGGGATGPISKRPINIITRAEVNAKLPTAGAGAAAPQHDEGGGSSSGSSRREKEDTDIFGRDGGGYVYICALNEYDIKGQRNWRVQMETQRGALLATEVRNNACKLKKFVASAMIAGCDDLKLGFVSRKTTNDNEHHVVLSVQSYQTRDLGLQIGLKAENAWGIIRAVVDLVMEKPDGRYVLLKDPTKPMIRLYSRPEDEEEGDEEEKEAERVKRDNIAAAAAAAQASAAAAAAASTTASTVQQNLDS